MKVELLAPAGSFESLRAAVNAGADAVYIGGTHFGARAYADNLSTQKMLEAIDYCHIHGRKLYLTVNTLLKENELTEVLYDYLFPFYESGLDAVIVQDTGVLSYIREAFPDLEIHASTQMTVTSAKGSLFLKNLGVSRVVAARELSLLEIAEIKKSVDIELESFVHGALCYCYSGQCLYSSLIGGRSGNRGRCAQPCRLPYDLSENKQRFNSPKERYLMNTKDICTLNILPDIIQAGVFSLKIEGRMKRPEYTAGVVSIYRKYIDKYIQNGKKQYRVADKDIQILLDLYNRGGFTNGYYKLRNGREMIALDQPGHRGIPAAKIQKVQKGSLHLQTLVDLYKNDALDVDKFVPGKRKELLVSDDIKINNVFRIDGVPGNVIRPGQILYRTRCNKILSQLRKDFIQNDIKEKINGKLIISLHKPAILNISMGIFCVQAEGDISKPALKQPLTIEAVKKQLLKTGDTPFIFESLDIEIEDSCFLPLQSLNELRRSALKKLEGKILLSGKRQAASQKPAICMGEPKTFKEHAYTLQVSVENISLLDELLRFPEIYGIYIDCSALVLPLERKQVELCVQRCHKNKKKCYYIMPHILRSSSIRKYEESAELLQMFDGVLVKNFDTIQFLQDIHYNKDKILDHNMYTYNRSARLFWDKRGIVYDTAPLELNFRELELRSCKNSEVVIYGYLPMMVSAQCLQKTTKGCTGISKRMNLTDRKGAIFPVKNNCSLCYNTIYNSIPLVLMDQKEEIDRLHPKYLRLSFTIEPVEKAMEITKKYIQKFVSNCSIENDFDSFTRGHFKRGIE